MRPGIVGWQPSLGNSSLLLYSRPGSVVQESWQGRSEDMGLAAET